MILLLLFVSYENGLFHINILLVYFHLQELALPLRTYKETFPRKEYLHPYERSLIELTLGDGNYEAVKLQICLKFWMVDWSMHVCPYSSWSYSYYHWQALGKIEALRKKVVSVGKEHASLCAKVEVFSFTR